MTRRVCHQFLDSPAKSIRRANQISPGLVFQIRKGDEKEGFFIHDVVMQGTVLRFAWQA